jgi:Tol biopolymer transport system component
MMQVDVDAVRIEGSRLADLYRRHDGLGGWSPDGSEILLWGDEGQQSEPPAVRLDHFYVIRPDGTGFTRIGNGQIAVGDATWSPDGSEIAFVWLSGDAGVQIMNADGSGQMSLGPLPKELGVLWRSVRN